MKEKLNRKIKEKTKKFKNDKNKLEKGIEDFEKMVAIGAIATSKSPVNRK